jgi:ferredoxin|tara:strand:- start:247 stop:507 length:261 start_codon:yes stop_codon:yes gene_type:complete
MLVINPMECIDCGVCQPECPADAIVPDNALDPDKSAYWEIFNQRYSDEWPNITVARPDDVPPDATEWDGVPNKLEDHFSEQPGQGD